MSESHLMKISDRLQCLFTAQVERRDESYVVEVPDQELSLGEIEDNETYQIAVLSPPPKPPGEREEKPERREGLHGPPVEEGETRAVEIETIGDQGDGITRVERGYVVIVPETETGERVRIEIIDVQENVAFADVVERLSYYE